MMPHGEDCISSMVETLSSGYEPVTGSSNIPGNILDDLTGDILTRGSLYALQPWG